MAVITIAGNRLVALFGGEHHADDDGFLADVEMAETADQPHAVQLPGFLFEAADEQHAPIGLEFLFDCELGRIAGFGGSRLSRFGAPVRRRCHEYPLQSLDAV